MADRGSSASLMPTILQLLVLSFYICFRLLSDSRTIDGEDDKTSIGLDIGVHHCCHDLAPSSVFSFSCQASWS